MYSAVIFLFILWTRVSIGLPHSRSSISTDITPTSTSTNKLLVILLDGCRWDYVYKKGANGFKKLMENGVHAESMVPIFPSITIPNLYCIATGLYAENHGMPFNYIHHNKKSNIFQMSPFSTDYDDPDWWNKTEPAWITSTKNNVKTHVYLWPGCEIPNQNRTPNYCLKYHHAFGVNEFRNHVDQMMNKFEMDEADFGMIYCEEMDFTGHLFGPDSPEELQVIMDIDQIIYNLQMRMEKSKKKINLIVVSDHGMSTTNAETVSKHKMDEFIDINEVEHVIDAGAMTQIYPKAESFDKIYQQLKTKKGYTIYKPEEIPEEFHLKHIEDRLPPILVLADKTNAISPLWMDKRQIPFNPIPFDVLMGNHGYRVSGNTDMRGIFLAVGPDFKEGYKAPAINNTDVYNLAMHLLHLTPHPNNGSWEAVNHMLKPAPSSSHLISLDKYSSSSAAAFTYNRLFILFLFSQCFTLIGFIIFLTKFT